MTKTIPKVKIDLKSFHTAVKEYSTIKPVQEIYNMFNTTKKNLHELNRGLLPVSNEFKQRILNSLYSEDILNRAVNVALSKLRVRGFAANRVDQNTLKRLLHNGIFTADGVATFRAALSGNIERRQLDDIDATLTEVCQNVQRDLFTSLSPSEKNNYVDAALEEMQTIFRENNFNKELNLMQLRELVTDSIFDPAKRIRFEIATSGGTGGILNLLGSASKWYLKERKAREVEIYPDYEELEQFVKKLQVLGWEIIPRTKIKSKTFTQSWNENIELLHDGHNNLLVVQPKECYMDVRERPGVHTRKKWSFESIFNNAWNKLSRFRTNDQQDLLELCKYGQTSFLLGKIPLSETDVQTRLNANLGALLSKCEDELKNLRLEKEKKSQAFVDWDYFERNLNDSINNIRQLITKINTSRFNRASNYMNDV